MMSYFPLQWTVLTLPFQEWSFQCSQKAIINNAKVTKTIQIDTQVSIIGFMVLLLATAGAIFCVF